MVLVAGGTGFAPIKSMLDDMYKRGIERPATLIWGARRPEGIYLRAAVEKWQKKWPGFRFIAAISEASGPLAPDMIAARADEALALGVPDLAGRELYCCGAPPMVAAVRATGIRLGLDPRDFHSDVFVDGPAAAPMPLDEDEET
jgi:NAD(P)H-flavin reductase